MELPEVEVMRRDLEKDVVGKRIITTGLNHTVTVREENAIAALEVMSRFAANPKWLIYLPPTMSPSETSDEPPVAQPFFTLTNGRPVGPSSLTIVSALPASSLPP